MESLVLLGTEARNPLMPEVRRDSALIDLIDQLERRLGRPIVAVIFAESRIDGAVMLSGDWKDEQLPLVLRWCADACQDAAKSL